MEKFTGLKEIDFNNLQCGFYAPNGEIINITEVNGEYVSFRHAKSKDEVVTYHMVSIEILKEVIHFVEEQPKEEETTDGEVRNVVFPKVLALLKANIPVYLYGPAGSGKNVLAKQLADEMGLKFYYANCVLTKFDLVGYGDANGNYVSTPFCKAFTEGGLFMLDEFDASAEEAAITLNAALANRYFDFPVIGNVEAHPDFKIIAAGNTCGRGADEEYTGRSCLDAATLDRFAMLKVDYDERVERKIARDEIVNFIHDLRNSRDEAGIKMILGYRAIDRLAKMESAFKHDELLEMAILKGMDKDEVNILYNGLREKQNTFAKALKMLAK